MSTGVRLCERFEWNADRLGQLYKLWNAGDTATSIGRAIGTSKSAVISKARREGLDARPSPIPSRKDDVVRATREARAERICGLRSTGMSFAAIGRMIDLDPSTVEYYVRRAARALQTVPAAVRRIAAPPVPRPQLPVMPAVIAAPPPRKPPGAPTPVRPPEVPAMPAIDPEPPAVPARPYSGPVRYAYDMPRGLCQRIVSERPVYMCGRAVAEPGGVWCRACRRLMLTCAGAVASGLATQGVAPA